MKFNKFQKLKVVKSFNSMFGHTFSVGSILEYHRDHPLEQYSLVYLGYGGLEYIVERDLLIKNCDFEGKIKRGHPLTKIFK